MINNNSKNIFVSIIIPSLNRENILIKALKSFQNQTYKNFEIIIVDQSDTPLNIYSLPRLEQDIKIFHTSQKGSHLARNYGVSKAKGSILIFIDDDVLIERKDFIKNHLKNFFDPCIGLVAGKVIQPWEEKNKPVKKAGRISKKLLIMWASFNSDRKQYTDGLVGCNFSCRKIIYLNLGGFDPNFIGTSYFEETDFAIRARKVGWKIIFDPETELKHLAYKEGGQREKAEQKIQQFYWFFHNYIYLFSKHGKSCIWPLFISCLLARGAFYILKYKNLKYFTQACVGGIIDGLRHANRIKSTH